MESEVAGEDFIMVIQFYYVGFIWLSRQTPI